MVRGAVGQSRLFGLLHLCVLFCELCQLQHIERDLLAHIIFWYLQSLNWTECCVTNLGTLALSCFRTAASSRRRGAHMNCTSDTGDTPRRLLAAQVAAGAGHYADSKKRSTRSPPAYSQHGWQEDYDAQTVVRSNS